MCVVLGISQLASAGPQWFLGPDAPNEPLTNFTPLAVYDSGRQLLVLHANGRTWEFDGRVWSSGIVAPSGLGALRMNAAMVFDSGRARTVLHGGRLSSVGQNDTWEYDGLQWQLVGGARQDMAGRYNHAMAYDPSRGVTVMYGGWGSQGELRGSWEFDGSQWRHGAPSPDGMQPRQGHAMVYDTVRSEVVVVSGWNSNQLLRDVWTTDGSRWSRGPSVPMGLETHNQNATLRAAFDTNRDALVVYSGRDYTNMIWELHGSAWQTGVQPLTGWGYQDPAIASTPDGIIIWGGRSAVQLALYDGQAWVELASTRASRSSHAMAYDQRRRRTVVVGGSESYFQFWDHGDTWEYDGVEWTPGPPTPIGPRYGSAMVYDAAREVMFLFGGSRRVWGVTWELLGDAWTYDGSDWTPVNAGAGPSARHSHRMVYEPGRDVTVLFGGHDGSNLLNDTWEWDGTDWRPGPTAPAGLAPRQGHAMTVDTSRGRVILVGGYGLLDTWEYDGSVWTSGPPPPLQQAPLVYDEARGVSIMVADAEFYEYDGLAWRAIPAGSPVERGWESVFDVARGRVVTYGSQPRKTEYETWELGCPIALSPATLGPLQVGSAVSVQFSATGGASPYQFDVLAGQVPPGLSLSPGGVLSGVPLQPGDFSPSLVARDSEAPTPCAGVQTLDIKVLAGPSP